MGFSAQNDSIWRFSVGHYLVILFGILLFASPVQAVELDSLRQSIRFLQNDIQKKEISLKRLSEKFNSVNLQIYELKAEQGNEINPFTRTRLQNALKNSHELADSIEGIISDLRKFRAELQQHYSDIIYDIDDAIKDKLKLARQNLHNRKTEKGYLQEIKILESEKKEYSGYLQAMQVDEKEWEKIVVQPKDTARRIKLKLSLLYDFEKKRTAFIAEVEHEIEKNESDKAIYLDMLDFLKEVDESLDDDQDIFDRTRIEEVEDKIDILNSEKRSLQARLNKSKDELTLLKAKIKHFEAAFAKKENLINREGQ